MDIPERKVRALHILNYADEMIDKVNIKLSDLTAGPGDGIDLFSPNKITSLEVIKKTGASLEIQISDLDTYAVVSIPCR